MAKQIDFPIKIINISSEGDFTELADIKVGPVDKSIFNTPENFTEMPVPGEQPVEVPDWASEIPSSPVLTPPFKQPVSVGNMIRIKVMPGKSVWLRVTRRSAKNVNAKAIPFKNGVPINEISMFNNFAPKGTTCERREETDAEADEIVIRVFTGSFTLYAKHFPMQEAQVVAGDNFAYKIVSSNYITARFVNTAEVDAEIILSYSKAGKELGEEVIGPETHRTVIIKPGKTVRRTLEPKGDTMIIRVKQGVVLIKLGQYDSLKW
jgi:hypothetical protein